MSKRKADEMTAWGLPQQMESLLESGLYSDLVIKCGETEFKVHRSVVCLQSEPLATNVRNNWKDSSTGEIDLTEDELFIVRMMLDFLYTGNFIIRWSRGTLTTAVESPREPLQEDTASPSVNTNKPHLQKAHAKCLLKLTKLYIVADRLLIDPLKRKCVEKYTKYLEIGWNSGEFCESLQLMFDETMEKDRALKDVAIKFAGQKVKGLLVREDFIVMCNKTAAITLAILQASAGGEVAVVSQGLTAEDMSKGCPWYGTSHTSFIERGTKSKAFYCNVCKKPFNANEVLPNGGMVGVFGGGFGPAASATTGTSGRRMFGQ